VRGRRECEQGLSRLSLPEMPDRCNFVAVEYAQHSRSWIKSGHVAIHGLLDCAGATQPKVQGQLFADRWVPLLSGR
jgi:hypothetical protein